MNKLKIIAIVTGVMCAVLVVSLVSVIYHFSIMVDQRDAEISDLEKTKANLLIEIEDMMDEIEEWRAANEKLTRENLVYKDQLSAADNLTGILIGAINGDNAGNLETIVVHVCDKDLGRLPNATYTYNQIRSQTGYEVFLLPELEGNLNWTKTYDWILTNFTDIPIVLPVFEGGNNSVPNLMLSIGDIGQAAATCDVRMIRLAEIVGWCMDHNQTFPTDYVKDALNFCRQHGLRVLWSEWKISDDAFQLLKDNVVGFEDIVTVVYQTNNKFDEPIIGFLKMSSEFPHWGASIQSWYYPEHGLGEMEEMPISLLAWHALLAKNMGAELLQFEPYWYFFDNGEAMEQFTTLKIMVF